MKNIFISLLFLLIYFISYSKDIQITLPHYDEIRPKIALALSGGGARGISQIGVIKFFEKNNINIDYISGTSIGAIIGGMYACGYRTEELEKLIVNNDWEETIAIQNNRRSELFIDQKDIFDKSVINIKLKNFNLIPPEAISSGNPFDSFINEIFWSASYQPENDFDKLKIPFRACATDLVKGKTVSFSSGNLSKIIRASATIPLRYTPVRIDSMILIDGGILANIPLNQLNEFHADIKIAVNTTSPLLKREYLNNAWNQADQVVSIAMKIFADNSLINADFVVTPPLTNRLNSDFSNLYPLINEGYESINNEKQEFFRIFNEKFELKFNQYLENLDFSEIIYPLNIIIESNNNNINNIIKQKFDKVKNSEDLRKIIQICIYNSKENNYILEISNQNLYILDNRENIIKNIEIYSNIPKINELNEFIRTKFINKIFNNNTEKIIIDSIYSFLRFNNIHFVQVDDLDYNSQLLKIKLLDNTLNKIEISGTEVRNFIVVRDLEIKTGEILTVETLLKSWQNLVNTDLFSDVELIPYRDENKKLNVLIKLKDGATQSIKIVARIDNERNSQAGIFFIQENIFNLGGRLNLGTKISSSYFLSNLILENSRFLNTSLNFNSEIYYENWKGFEYFHNYDKENDLFLRDRFLNNQVDRFGIKLGSGLQIGRDGKFYNTIKFEKQKYNNVTDNVKSDFYNVSTIKLGLYWDNIDDKYFPKKGRLIDLSFETNLIQNPDFLGFTKVFFKYKSFNSIGRHTSGISFLFGAGDMTLPYPEFFFLGGQESFFGLMEQELGGRQVFKASLEYLYKIPFDIFFDTYFFARYDIGNIWTNQEEIRLIELRQGLGAGISLNTPIGPAKLSYGKSFTFVKNDKNNFYFPSVLYFSIGIELF